MFNHIPLAPEYVNQVLQNRGIEEYVRELNRLNKNVDFRFHTEHSVFPDSRAQAWIDYHLYVVENGAPHRLFVVRLGTDYTNPNAPAEYEFRSFTAEGTDLNFLGSPDMVKALAVLDEKIRQAILKNLKKH
jgi:hypothetical protein